MKIQNFAAFIVATLSFVSGDGLANPLSSSFAIQRGGIVVGIFGNMTDHAAVDGDTWASSSRNTSEPFSRVVGDPNGVFCGASEVLLWIGIPWLLINWLFMPPKGGLSGLLCLVSWICVIFLAVIFFGCLKSLDRQNWIDGLRFVSSVSPDNHFIEDLLTDWLRLYFGPILFCLNCLIYVILPNKTAVAASSDGQTVNSLKPKVASHVTLYMQNFPRPACSRGKESGLSSGKDNKAGLQRINTAGPSRRRIRHSKPDQHQMEPDTSVAEL